MLILQKSVPLLQLIWELHHQLAFATTIRYEIHNCLPFEAKKQALIYWLFEVVTGYNIKVSCISSSSTVYIAITIWTN